MTVSLALISLLFVPHAEPLPGTQPLTRSGDLAMEMVAGIDRYLERQLADAPACRQALWQPDLSSEDAFHRSVALHRDQLRRLLGVVDPRVPFADLDYVSTTSQPALLATTPAYRIYAMRWPVLPGVDAEGLLLEPEKAIASAVALPDADQTPEMIAGLTPGVPAEAQYARRLAENRVRVLVPVLIDRADTWSGNPRYRMTNQPHREFIYRMAFEMGRHILGYEVQKVLAAVDWLARPGQPKEIGVIGHGEGGLIALYAGALEPRLRTTCVSGAFAPMEDLWRQPIYRNVFGLLREHGAAELAVLCGGPRRRVVIELSPWPSVDGPPPPHDGRGGAAPGRLATPELKAAVAEYDRAMALGLRGSGVLNYGFGYKPARLVSEMLPATVKIPKGEPPAPPRPEGPLPDPVARQKRQFEQLVAFTQNLMRDAEYRRQATFWSRLKPTSPEDYSASCKPLRAQLGEEVIGKLPPPKIPLRPQTREILDQPRWRGYEVTLDVYPDVFAQGILLLPKDLKANEKRPVVVCQHGLEGRPIDVVNPSKRTAYYNSFGAQLADRGYIVYAPQNPYIGKDAFRVLQRKANPLGFSLFSFIVRQHERTLDWLASLPMVDSERMAFYGLSYGGKTAMRVPALLPRYCLSICSGDFNEWIWKNTSVDFRGSYMFTFEYEMPEFNLGLTFGYAEMAALIAPRPFMVERGHDDGVGIDEWVAYEYAKVRRHYSRLKLPERTEIEFFPGGHEIHGVGTFRFLQQHLGWPR